MSSQFYTWPWEREAPRLTSLGDSLLWRTQSLSEVWRKAWICFPQTVPVSPQCVRLAVQGGVWWWSRHNYKIKVWANIHRWLHLVKNGLTFCWPEHHWPSVFLRILRKSLTIFTLCADLRTQPLCCKMQLQPKDSKFGIQNLRVKFFRA